MRTPSQDHSQFDYARWLRDAVREVGAQVLVLDVRDDLSRETVEGLRKEGLRIALLDDLGQKRLSADLAFYPPIPQVRRLEWGGFTGKLFVGWEWVALRRQFASIPSHTSHGRPTVLVTMGASDPAGLTLMAVAALDRLGEDFDAVVVEGRGFSRHEELEARLAGARRRFELLRNVDDMATLMARADLAVSSFGVTAYELASAGVPAIHLCLTDDHAKSALEFTRAGMAVTLGAAGNVTEEALAGEVSRLLSDEATRRAMGEVGRSRVDGCGARRIARVIANGMEEEAA
ncbi:MAG: hypothetical protein M1550_02605 [Deltaproteobacteria bacterium]|nr:hypothetical protein [Deltaproteobacteria bacterium]